MQAEQGHREFKERSARHPAHGLEEETERKHERLGLETSVSPSIK